MTNITRYELLPATITAQEKIDYEAKIFGKGAELGIGYIQPAQTKRHSNFIDHPSNGTCVYVKNGTFNKIMTATPEIERDNYKSSTNFATATDDTLYSHAQIKALGFFPEENL